MTKLAPFLIAGMLGCAAPIPGPDVDASLTEAVELARIRRAGGNEAAAVRLLATRANVVAEGAGAAPVAAALSGEVADGPVVCVISGGNIDADKLATILDGGVP